MALHKKDSRYYIKRIAAHLFQYFNFKTLLFNFKYFPFSKAIILPVYVSRKTWLGSLKGSVEIHGKLAAGIISIGYGDVPVFDKPRSRSVWNVKGKIIFNGPGDLGHGVKICVYENAVLTFGKNIQLTAESSILCEREIAFGNDCLLSWDILIMDTDSHKIFDIDRKLVNYPASVIIGNNVWIGSRVTIIKGVKIPDGCIVASGSVMTKQFHNTNTILSGNPAMEKRKIHNWSPEQFSKF